MNNPVILSEKPLISAYNMDCRIAMLGLVDGSIDLTVTSPPYDNLRTYNGSLEWNEDIWKAIIRELYRVTKQGGVVVWLVCDATINGSETGTSFKQALYFKEVGFNLHDTMIYEAKGTGAKGSIYAYWQAFEYMFIFSKGRPKTVLLIKDNINISYCKITPGGRYREGSNREKPHKVLDIGIRNNIWQYNVGFTNKSDRGIHPAPFPEKLAHDHVISWSNEGDTILDPMMGSGTTGKMAYRLNRDFIGIEKNREYFDAACERFERETRQMKLFSPGA